jgi:hypothetical protein
LNYIFWLPFIHLTNNMSYMKLLNPTKQNMCLKFH